MKKMSITDIAEIAGVSVSTVSRALQDSPLISVKTKELVQSIAVKHSFSINKRASNFRKQSSHIIGLLCIMNHAEKQDTSDQFLFSLINAISSNLHKHQYDLLLHTTSEITAQLASSYVNDQKVDGLIIVGQGKNQHDEILKLSEMNIPFVVWGGQTDRYITVGSDNVEGGYKATKHMIEKLGRSNIIFLGPKEHLEIGQRYEGYNKALFEAGLSSPVKRLEKPAFCIDSGYTATDHLLDINTKFDALVCASDTIALGAIKCLSSRGINVPEDVAVIGFDDISFAKDWSPKLSTIHQNTHLAGELLVQKILGRVRGEEVKSVQMGVELILRQTA